MPSSHNHPHPLDSTRMLRVAALLAAPGSRR